MAFLNHSSRSIIISGRARTALFSAVDGHASSLPVRAFNSNDAANNIDDTSNDQLRIAIVGGGASGMTAALHLAPLVAAGLIQGPIDVYESTIIKKKNSGANTNQGHEGGNVEWSHKFYNQGHGKGKQSYPGSGAIGRNIGVGIWSTAWSPFLKSLAGGLSPSDGENSSANNLIQQQRKNRQSYRTLLEDLEACGSYVHDVGYRTPNGSWLVKSELNASPLGIKDLMGNNNDSNNPKNIDNDDPALLFVREKDLLSCLRNAIKIEQRLGTVKYHSGVRVDGIENVNGDSGSLELQSWVQSWENTTSLSPQYNLIIAAGGIYSLLRSRFAGHQSIHAMGTGIDSSSPPKNTLQYEWEHTKGQREATQVEDRGYIVFRGNAPKLESGEEDGSGSFQTWGEERSMRFAAVPFYHETEDIDDDDDGDSNSGDQYNKIHKKKDEEVWFATISDPAFIDAFKNADPTNAPELKQMLLEAFGSWHKPIKTLIETTPAEDIMYEMATAHRHNATPVFDLGRIMEFEMWQENLGREMHSTLPGDVLHRSSLPNANGKIAGRGPILCFLGDSMMTVDPVLAQGFTIAMEGGASIAESIEHILVHPSAASSGSTPVYQPKLLRQELLDRHYNRERRLLQLLRSTELVQRLAQPHGFGSFFATWIVRPVVKLCPDSIKKKVFDYMIRYSLGLR